MSNKLPETKPLTQFSSVNGNTPLSVKVENSVNVTNNENIVNEVQDSAHEVDYLTLSGFESSALSSTALSANLLVDEFNVDDKLNKTFIGKQLLSIPFNCRVVAKNTYNRLLKLPVKGAFQANTYLRALCDFCEAMPVDVTWSDSQIELVGKTQASQCHQICINMLNLDDSREAVVFALEAVLVGFSIKARKGKYIDGK